MSLLEQVNLIGSSAWSTQREETFSRCQGPTCSANGERSLALVLIAQPLALLVPAVSLVHHHEVT